MVSLQLVKSRSIREIWDVLEASERRKGGRIGEVGVGLIRHCEWMKAVAVGRST